MDKKIKIGLGMIATISIIAAMIAAYKKKKAAKQDADYEIFSEQLENAEEPEKIERAALQQAFDPEYWKSVASRTGVHKVISQDQAKTLAKKIEAAWNGGTFWDDLEEEVYDAFKDAKLKTFADVSKVADAYLKNEVAGKDLWKHLAYKLSDSEFAVVKSIVAKKINKYK